MCHLACCVELFNYQYVMMNDQRITLQCMPNHVQHVQCMLIVQYSTVQYSTVQYSTVQYSTAHPNKLHYGTEQYVS